MRDAWKRRLVYLSLLICILLCGCGDGNLKVSEAMSKIEELSYQEALGILEEAVVLQENETLILRAQGIAYLGMCEYEKSIECFEKALSTCNGMVREIDYDINYYLACAYGKLERWDKAEHIYNTILSMRDTELQAYYLRGVAQMGIGKYGEAKGNFEYVISKEPKNFDRIIEIYQIMEHYGQEEMGRELLELTMEKQSKQMNSFDSGRFYYYLGEYQKACRELEKVKKDGAEENHLYLGKAYEATGDYNYATSVYYSYLSKNEGSQRLYNQLGICEMKRMEYEKALEAFQKGLLLEEQEMRQTLSFNEIVAYESLGDYETAYALIQRYLQLYPDDEEAKREEIFLRTR